MTQKRTSVKVSSVKSITIDDLGNFTEQVIFPGVERIVQESILGVRQELTSKIDNLGQRVGNLEEHVSTLAGKIDDLKEQVLDEVRKENLKNLKSNDLIITKLDTILKDQAAHTSLHIKIADDLMSHEKRITKLEETKIS